VTFQQIKRNGLKLPGIVYYRVQVYGLQVSFANDSYKQFELIWFCRFLLQTIRDHLHGLQVSFANDWSTNDLNRFGLQVSVANDCTNGLNR